MCRGMQWNIDYCQILFAMLCQYIYIFLFDNGVFQTLLYFIKQSSVMFLKQSWLIWNKNAPEGDLYVLFVYFIVQII